MSTLKRRIMALSLSSVIAALGFQTSADAAGNTKLRDAYELDRYKDLRVPPQQEQGYLVRGEKGEYYYLTKSQLARLAHKGKCHKSQCVRVAPTRVIVRKSALGRFLQRGAGHPLRAKIRDPRTLKSLNSSIARRQALGAKVRGALAKQGFEVGVLYPTKAG